MSSVSIRNIFFSYSRGSLEIPIFKDFNLDVRQGDFIAIKGPSGSGKSTLLYLMAGLLKIQKGSVRIDGRNIHEMSDMELSLLRNKKMAFVFQQFHLLPKTTVLDNILLPTFYPVEHTDDMVGVKERAIKIATELGINEHLDHLTNQLSGGQQQRTAIARALINDVEIILADEPTGNLDSKATDDIIAILRKLNKKGKTIILITHEDEVAKSASKVYFLKDGALEKIEDTGEIICFEQDEKQSSERGGYGHIPLSKYFKMIPLSISNAFRNKTRSFLTMLGIVIGVAAVCSMVTLGNFTKDKILESYAELGVNTIIFNGYPNWNLKATDNFPLKYQFFDWETEILPLKKIFPGIHLISPRLFGWRSTVTYAGKAIENESQLVGISEDGLEILNRNLIAGRGISRFNVDRKHFVCIIGYDVAKRLFKNTSPLDKVIHVAFDGDSTFGCKVTGVLESKTSNKGWSKPNLQIFVPFTAFQTVSHWWRSQIKEVTIKFHQGADTERTANFIKKFFEQKYGVSGKFNINSDSILVAQMKKFLTMFSVLLTVIALVSLLVGGMGITNMMLVSVSERLKEIGIRKSVGATHSSIRYQFLFESVFLCLLAGLLGIVVGVISYQGAIWGASQLISKLEYEWVFDPVAILLSLISIVAVGIFSGMAPAIKAERLQVVDALRSE